METKTALITGITGQDGYYLSRLLLKKGYEVHGIVRRITRESVEASGADESVNVTVHYGDVRDFNTIERIIQHVKPDELYHLASQSDVMYSFMRPDETYHTNIDGTLHVLNALRSHSNTRMYFAGTSEMFGQPKTKPQNETYPMFPRSPYAISKLAGFHSCRVYRDSYHTFISNGILFNHESPRRGPNFVTRKITLGIANYLKTGQPFSLGNIEAKKDWGYAEDYVEGMWMMLQHTTPDDFVLGTMEQHTVKEFLMVALSEAKIQAVEVSDSTGVTEIVEDGVGRPIVIIDRNLYRPLEADNYMGDYTKANQLLGWQPKTRFKDLVHTMVVHDIEKT
jgi:GDPmannose 4,6-dehydratase